MNKTRKNLYLKGLNIVLTVGVFYFAYIYGKYLFNNADFSTLQGRYWLLIIAFVTFGLSYVVGSLHWLYVCRIVRPEASAKQFLAFFASQPYKYLPSSIFTFSYRASYSKTLGMPIKSSSLAQLIENFNIIGSGLAVSLFFYILYINTGIGVALILLALFVVIFLYRINFVVNIPKTNRKIKAIKIIPGLLMACIMWLVSGVAFLLVNYSLGFDLNPLIAISANSAAYVVSIFVVFAPGGIGVRELTLSFFSIQNPSILLWRLVTFIADMILGIVAIAWIKLKESNA